jgi:hypothetical protein
MGPLEIKIIVSELNIYGYIHSYMLDEINNKLYTAEEKNSGLESIALETTTYKVYKGKRRK